jgi:curli biogenesis system outer membrane secretion channel CsgG
MNSIPSSRSLPPAFRAVALFALVLPLAPLASAQPSELLKKQTATKTSDDGAKSRMTTTKGVKHAIGVTDFTNQSTYHAWSALGGNLKYMLESALSESGRFVMVERINLGTVVAEQDLQQSGRAAQAKNVAETGKLRSAKYVATGAITEVTDESSGDSGGLAIRGFRIGGSSSKSAVVLMVKLIDTTSGEIVASKRVRGEAGKSGLKIGIAGRDGAGDLGTFAKTSLGQAAQDCINEAVKFIAESMQKTRIESSVVAVTKDEAVVSMGENYGIEPGMRLIVQKDGEILKDPDTGAILDRLEGAITGTLEVTRVREKTAYAKVVDGAMPVRGDRVIVK